MRYLTHGALVGFVLVNAAHLLLVMMIGSSWPTFIGFLSAAFFCIGLIGPNASALAMERMGHIAGSAAAANGFAGTTLAGLLGTLIGRQFDGTTVPIIAGFAILGALSLLIVLWVEKGRLFQIGEATAKQGSRGNT